MNDIIIEYIKALGYPICTSIAIGYALVKVFKLYVEAVQDRIQHTEAHAGQLATLSTDTKIALAKNTAAMDARTFALEQNTEATEDLSRSIKKLVDEPAGFCKFKP